MIMSEIINNHSQYRFNELCNFARQLMNGTNGRKLIETHQEVIKTVTPVETMQMFDVLLNEGFSFEKVKEYTGKIINVFFKSLEAQQWKKPSEPHFIYYLMQENVEVKKHMLSLKALTKELFHTSQPNLTLLNVRFKETIALIKQYELHYIKKENILFSYIEKAFPQYKCLQLMWSFHDDFRKSVKNIETIINDGLQELEQLNIEMGKLFFVVLPIIFREEQIVFPVVLPVIQERDWQNMLIQANEIGWCYINQPQLLSTNVIYQGYVDDKIDLNTGYLSAQQLMLLFKSLPVDITFVNENDEVCYFSETSDRIFPRSKAIIGRKVQNCHPPESVHVVNQIIDDFKSKQRSHADFWIQIHARFVHIRYFALYDDAGVYQGTIEVSQDVTEIRTLTGEKRLLV